MTSVVGVLCKDGVVLGTDSSATLESGQVRTIEQPIQKLDVIGECVIVAGTGQIGLGQRFCAVVQQAWNNKEFQTTPIEVGKNLTKLAIKDFAETGAQRGQYGALVAFPAEHKLCLCEFSVTDFQPEQKTERLWYCSMGSAQPITDPFLAFIREVFWDTGLPTVQEAIFAVTWTLDHAISVNPGGVNGPAQIAVLEHGRKTTLMARVLSEEELGEHRQNIEAAKQLLRSLKLQHQPTNKTATPPLP